MSPSPSSTQPEPTNVPETEDPVAAPTVEPTSVSMTDEPAPAASVEPTMAEEPASTPTAKPTLAPEAAEPTMYETDAPKPVQAVEPMDEPSSVPKAMTLAPASFAPSVTAPMPDGECKDPVGAFAQVIISETRCRG